MLKVNYFVSDFYEQIVARFFNKTDFVAVIEINNSKFDCFRVEYTIATTISSWRPNPFSSCKLIPVGSR